MQGSKFKSIPPVNNASSLVKKEIRSDSTKVFSLPAIQISACYLSEPEPRISLSFLRGSFQITICSSRATIGGILKSH